MKTLLRVLLAAVACAAPARAAAQPLHLVLTPSQKPTDLLAAGEEFGQALGRLYGAPVRVTVASDYAAVIEALRNRTADLAFVHPVGYVLASREAKARIVARNLWHGKSTFTSRIYVRKDGGITTLEDLRDKTMAFVDPSSASGYTYPMVLLIQRGLVKNRDPKTFFREVMFAGAHDAAMRALLNGHVDAIASFDMAREQYLTDPAEREKIAFVAETAAIPEAGIAARDGLAPAAFAKVRAALLQMRGPAYASLLKRMYDIDGFQPAQDRDYDPRRAVPGAAPATLRARRRQMGRVFQQFTLVRRVSVLDNVLAGRLGWAPALPTLFAPFPAEDRRIALECLAQVGLADFAHRRADTLSGGEQQRVAIARALAQSPAVILADEPTASLDPALTGSIMDLLKTIRAQRGLTLVVSQYQLETALAYATRVVGFRQGRVVFDGPPAALSPAVAATIYGEEPRRSPPGGHPLGARPSFSRRAGW